MLRNSIKNVDRCLDMVLVNACFLPLGLAPRLGLEVFWEILVVGYALKLLGLLVGKRPSSHDFGLACASSLPQ